MEEIEAAMSLPVQSLESASFVVAIHTFGPVGQTVSSIVRAGLESVSVFALDEKIPSVPR